MHTFEVRATEDALVLTGGQLAEPLVYPAHAIHSVIQCVGFLSQRDGSELHIFDIRGLVASTRTFAAGVPLPQSAKLGKDDY